MREGKEKADELDKLGADIDEASRATWLAGEVQFER